MLGVALFVGYVAWFLLRKTAYSGLMPHMLPLFALGALGADITHGPGRAGHGRVPWIALGTSAALLAVAGGIRLGIDALIVRAPFLDPLIGIATLSLLITLPRSPRLQKLLGGVAPVFLGVMGYSLYLMHAPLLQLLWQYVLNPLSLAPIPTFLLLLLGLGGVVGGCYLFFLCCERPFLKRRGVA
jgi:peptidoglycan/LPS O-acetylase OafA/YrhL